MQFCEIAYMNCSNAKCFKCKDYQKEIMMIHTGSMINDNIPTYYICIDDAKTLIYIEKNRVIIDVSDDSENFGIEFDMAI